VTFSKTLGANNITLTDTTTAKFSGAVTANDITA
jgi:hypothetical protein